MAPFVPAKGKAFWFSGTGSSFKPETAHLFVLLTDQCGEGDFLVVNISSSTGAHDKTCELGANDHPDLKHASFAYYARIRRISAKTLGVNAFGNMIKETAPFPAAVFDRICEGVMKSAEVAPKYRAYFEANRGSRGA